MPEAIQAIRAMFVDRELVHDQNREYNSYANLKHLNYIIGFKIDDTENVVYYGLTKVRNQKQQR